MRTVPHSDVEFTIFPAWGNLALAVVRLALTGCLLGPQQAEETGFWDLARVDGTWGCGRGLLEGRGELVRLGT